MSTIMHEQIDSVNHLSDPVDADVLEIIHAVMHQVRSCQMRGAGTAPHDITPMEGKVLGFYSRNPGATQSDLAMHTGRDKGQIARLIAGLRAKNLLEARADTHDGRVTRIFLTEGAHALHADLQRQRKELSALAVAGMEVEQKQQLVALLPQMKNNLQQLL